MMTEARWKVYEKLSSVLPFNYTLFDVNLGKVLLCFIDSKHGRDTISITGSTSDLDALADHFLLAFYNKYPKEKSMAKKKASGSFGQVDLNPTPSVKAPKPVMALPKPMAAPKAPPAIKLPKQTVQMAPLPKAKALPSVKPLPLPKRGK